MLLLSTPRGVVPAQSLLSGTAQEKYSEDELGCKDLQVTVLYI